MLFFIVTFYVLNFCVLAYEAANAPMGYEDEDGFHVENTRTAPPTGRDE